ncbi:anti-CBASS protein Acb1 family protein [Brevundimonas sp.]|uniref:anti-CBASS protein Acb1 family protein n=1 Tax=Brevundimonas sp. TaxID=1871086 RepID=UPI0028A015E6|nr:anti-CBASS Acb1 family protein [Brevundimonas sp.]
MGEVITIGDGLANALSGLNTERDKAAHSYYAEPTVDPAELINAYRGSWMARKIVDIPALDSCRAWRAWQAADGQIELIEAEEKRLNAQGKVLEARKKARLFGGAAVYADFGDDASKPLDLERVKKGGIRFLTVFTPRQLVPGEIETDPMSEFFGMPKEFTVAGGAAGHARIHPSRLTTFYGAELPDRDITSSAFGWGDSVLVSVMSAVKQAESASANINSLIFEANVDVVSIEGLAEILKMAGGEDKVRDLLKLNLDAKSNLRALILDAKNTYARKAVSFASLPDLLDRFDQHAAGAADIPMTRFMGMSPGGLNSAGESDLRNYYDRISAGQTLEMGPALTRLDEALIRSATGTRDPAIHYDWNPLWQLSEKDKADIFKTKSDAARTIAGNGGTSEPLMPIEALSDALVNELVEDGSLAGLEAAIEEYGKLGEQDGEGDDEAAALSPLKGQQPNPIIANDAAPRTLYVQRKLLNAAEFIAWAKSQGFETTTPADDLHVTIAYSRRPVDWMKVGETWSNSDEGMLTIAPGGARLVEPLGDKGAVVLLFNSSELSWRHEAIKRDADATWDFPSYQPHVTITYAGGDVDLSKVEPYRGKLVFGPELFSEVDADWSKKLSEA